MEAARARSNPFASAAQSVRESTRRAAQLVDDGALDTTQDGEEPVTDDEVRRTLATVPDRGRRP
jgi:hypothetical protein